MVERELLLYISFMIWKITQEHYVPPPNHCTMGMTCNHSSVPLCGFEKNKNCYRMFLDECDLYEYNCDNKADFFTSEINNCSKMSDDNNDLCDSKQNMNGTILTTTTTTTTINTTTIKMTTSAEAMTAKNKTVVLFSPSTVSNITTCTKGDNLITEMVTEKSNTETLDGITVKPNVINKEKSNVDKNVTVASKTTILNSTTVPNLIKNNSSNTTTTENVTDNTSNRTILSNNMTIKYENMTAIISTTIVKLNVSSIAKEETTEPMMTKMNDKEDVKQENCDFPSYCNRPKTWLTTSKGETRDFYRIIKDNEG